MTSFLSRLRTDWRTLLLVVFFFALPWQTRWIFGSELINGAPTEFGVMSVYALEALVAVIALAWCASRKTSRFAIADEYRKFVALASVIGVVAVLSTAFALRPVFAFASLIPLAAAGIVFTLLLDDRVRIRPLLLAFALGLVIPIFLGVYQVVVGESSASTILGLASRDATRLGDAVIVLADGTRVLRAYGSFAHPNVLGGFAAVGVCAVLALWRKDARRSVRVLLGALAAVLLLGLAFSMSRSAILGLVLGLGLFFVVRTMRDVSRARRVVIPVAAFVILGALFVSVFVPNLAASIRGGGRTENLSLSERSAQYVENGAVTLGASIVFGRGIGNYVFALAEAFPNKSAYAYAPVHNVILLLIGELGIVGLAVVLLWSSSIDAVNFARFPNRDAALAFAMGSVILVVLFFDHYLWSSWQGLTLVAFVMALTVRMGEGERLASTTVKQKSLD